MPENQEEEDYDFRELLRIVLKHRGLMTGVFLAVVGLSLVYCLTAKRVWEGTVSVKLPDATANVGGAALQAIMSLSSATDPVETYMEIGQSVNVGMRAARAVDLTDTAQFSSATSLYSAVDELLKKGVTVTNTKDSNLLVFQVQVQDPGLAARLANAWAQAFIEANLDFERIGASSRRAFIEAQMVQIKLNLTNGEEALKRLAQRQGVVHSTGAGGALDPAVALESRIEDLLLERSQLASLYNPDYPQLKAMNAEYQAAMAEQSKLPENEMDYTRLERDVKAYETVYNFLIDKDQEARIDENSNDSGIVVVDSALPPSSPVAPQKTLIMVISIMAGLLLSLSVGYGLERWQDQVGSEIEMELLTGLPVLALIPNWRVELRSSSISEQKAEGKLLLREKVSDDSASLIHRLGLKHTYYNESFRILRTNLAFSGVDRKIKSFCVLSPNMSEGKSLVNANLALALAATGKKVLLVDADLRKPRVHKFFGLAVSKDQGLPTLLSGQVPDLEAHLFPGPVPCLWLLPCGVMAPNPSELLSSSAMLIALETMTQRFDHVVFDVAPVLPVTDGVILAARLDGAVMLARFEQTRRAELRRALQSLAAVHAPVLGTILNAVDMDKYSYTYGYGGGYYSYHEKR